MATLISRFTGAKRVVIKIGSSLLVDSKNGRLRRDWLIALSQDIAKMRRRGQEVLVVSSGSIALGRHILGLKNSPLRLEESQAAAATGQIQLAHAYQEILALENIPVAQILLTPGDTEERRRYLNARSTITTLLSLGALPVVNENDTVATIEIRYGDNDRLAARVAQMITADCLILLSDVDGLYTADPKSGAGAQLIREVSELSDDILAMAGKTKTDVGRGPVMLTLPGIRANFGVTACMATGPSSGSSTSIMASRARYCAELNISSIENTGPPATRPERISSIAANCVLSENHLPTISSSSLACSTRFLLVANRGSVISSGRPICRAKFSKIDWAEALNEIHLPSLD